jgi:SAM-dependent methyltransferase
VTCQQGLQFFPDRPAAAREMRRALRPGGRVGIAVWAEIDRCPPFRALADGIEAVVGADLAERYRRGPWGFPQPDRLATLLEQTGFDEVRVSRHLLPVTFGGGPAELVSTLVTTPLAGDFDQLSEGQRRRLVEATADRIGSGPIESRLESNVALARRA